jgi:hypothetical protein
MHRCKTSKVAAADANLLFGRQAIDSCFFLFAMHNQERRGPLSCGLLPCALRATALTPPIWDFDLLQGMPHAGLCVDPRCHLQNSCRLALKTSVRAVLALQRLFEIEGHAASDESSVTALRLAGFMHGALGIKQVL